MKKKYSIKTRILAGVLVLLGIAFASIFVVFNISVTQYIDVNVKRQLDIAREMMSEGPGAQEEGGKLKMHGQPQNPVGAEANMFLWNGDSVLTESGMDTDTQTEQGIAENLDIEAALREAQTVRTADGSFLVSALENSRMPDEYMILYVDITDMQTFAQNINVLLIIILAVIGAAAVAVAFALAGSIARPIRQISDFAKKIGENMFEQSELELKDKETSDLLNVMNRTAKKLKTYDSEQKTFFQNVSHELKTPLMTIRCNAEGIVYHVMQPEESGRTIIRETDRLGELIDDLLYISKMDTITESEVLEECDLREILSNCAESQRMLAAQRKVKIEYDFSDRPVMKNVSEKSMQRALCNVISNAIRYAETKIVLSCRKEGDKAVISVWDDGHGISASDLPHIFERFYKGKGGQSGIGLSIVKSVVDKLGGSISVDTEDGTRFTLEL